MANPEIKAVDYLSNKTNFYNENNFLTIFYITDTWTCLEIRKNC